MNSAGPCAIGRSAACHVAAVLVGIAHCQSMLAAMTMQGRSVWAVSPFATVEDSSSQNLRHAALPVPDDVAETVAIGRRDLQRILAREDPRLMVVVGPCSIHDPVAGIDYAQRLKALAEG